MKRYYNLTILSFILIVSLFLHDGFSKFKYSGTINGKRYSNRNSKKSYVKEKYITNTGKLKYVSRISNRVKRGTKVYFYFKLGNVKYSGKHGIYAKFSAVIKKGRRIVQRIKPMKAQALKANSKYKKDMYLPGYSNSMFNIKFPFSFKKGSYKVVVTFHNLNDNSKTDIKYRVYIY